MPFRRYWGFDSFEGLPDEGAGIKRSSISKRFWQPGHWSAADVLGDYDSASVQHKVFQYISDARVEFVTGYYNESLRATLPRERGMAPALFVEIDCDLYISSVQALDFMLAQKVRACGARTDVERPARPIAAP